ncbi:MAG: methyltransferase domain-containing protein [Chloroflexi bacterium]|nr:methyltransferase domain-containing protein [Chloroflexota bacterium]
MSDQEAFDGEVCPVHPLAQDAQALRAAVRDRYAAVALEPEARYSFQVGRDFALALGYPFDLLSRLPASAIDAFTGVGTPVLQAEIQVGERVLDLGCGAGLDLAIAAEAAGPGGRVLGIDIAPPMARRARETVGALRLTSAWAIVAAAEALPLADDWADVVVANGILNLAPRKAAILVEAARILKPGGRFVLAETTLRHPISPNEVRTLDDWFR